MSAANLLTETDVITVEQFLDMDLPDSCEWLLVHGTVVSVTHAQFPHSLIQQNINELFTRLAVPAQALVFTELPYELDRTNGHCADVAVLRFERTSPTIKAGGIVEGSPELVVESCPGQLRLSRAFVFHKHGKMKPHEDNA